jgi:hypothetical protein
MGATVIDSGQPMPRTEYVPYSDPRQATGQAAGYAAPQPYDYTERVTGPMPPAPAAPRRTSSVRILVGCGCLFLLVTFLCIATILLLDSYNNGVLLYCGPLRPFWEAVLGAGRVVQQCGTA